MASDQEVIRFLQNPVNFLYAADWRSGQFRFVPATREALSTLSFLDNRTLGTSRRQGALPIDQVSRLGGEFQGACDFIFHSAFCCSTLIARALDVPGRVLSLKEPLAVLNLSGLLRERGPEAFKALAGPTLRLLARPFSKAERILIKPSNGANNLLPGILDAPGAGRVLLLYGGLEDFLVAVISGGSDRQAFVDGILDVFLRDFGGELDLPDPAEVDPLARAALVWGLQVRAFEQTSAAAPEDKVKTLAAEKFLADPGKVLAGLSAFFGYGYGEDDISTIIEGPVFKIHAKENHRSFNPDEKALEHRETREAHAGDIEAAVKFLDGLGLAAPVLKNPL